MMREARLQERLSTKAAAMGSHCLQAIRARCHPSIVAAHLPSDHQYLEQNTKHKSQRPTETLQLGLEQAKAPCSWISLPSCDRCDHVAAASDRAAFGAF